MKKYNILVSCDQIYTSSDVFESYLSSKLLGELEKHFEVNYIGFVRKDCKIKETQYSSFIELPFYGHGIFGKIGNFLFMNWIKFLSLKKYKGDLIWTIMGNSIHYIFYFLFPVLFNRNLYFVQLGAVAVNKSRIKRSFYNSICRFNLLFYKHIGVDPASSGGKLLIKTYKIPLRKIVPVIIGMPDYGFSPKNFDRLRLVYIGTINTRDVWKSIRGVALFKNNHPEIELTYDIIGGGNVLERNKMQDEIDSAKLNNVVKYHGPLPVEDVKNIFQRCNVGVSYVPINEYFQNSSTKTVEYLLAGMAVIATNNKVRSEIVKPESGVLCEDNPESFADAIHQIYNNFSKYNSYKIRELYKKYSISASMKANYFPFLDKLIEKTKSTL